MTAKIVFFVVTINLVSTLNYQKYWKTGISTKDPSLWSNNQLPCLQQTIVFPENLNGLVALHTKTIDFGETMGQNGFIFPRNGGIMFPDESLISDPTNQFDFPEKCDKNSKIKEARFKSLPQTPYYSTKSWNGPNNEAIPHIERIPCQYDTVKFPAFRTFRADFHYADKIVAKEFEIEERVNKDELYMLLASETGQLLFPHSEETDIEEGKCMDAEKCECQNEDLLTYVCDYEVCEAPRCREPIKLDGHCCDMCGSVFTLDLDGKDLDFSKFEDKLKNTIKSSNFDEKYVNYHVSIKKSAWQLIIVDVGEYSQKSVELMEYLQENFLKGVFKDHSKTVKNSGVPYSPNGNGHAFLFLFMTFLVVSSFFSVMYLYYYDNNTITRLTGLIRNQNLFQSPFVFARFDPHNENEDESPINIDIQAERIEDLNNSSFHNPMYEEATGPKDDNTERAPEINSKNEEDEVAIYTEVELQEK